MQFRSFLISDFAGVKWTASRPLIRRLDGPQIRSRHLGGVSRFYRGLHSDPEIMQFAEHLSGRPSQIDLSGWVGGGGDSM